MAGGIGGAFASSSPLSHLLQHPIGNPSLDCRTAVQLTWGSFCTAISPTLIPDPSLRSLGTAYSSPSGSLRPALESRDAERQVEHVSVAILGQRTGVHAKGSRRDREAVSAGTGADMSFSTSDDEHPADTRYWDTVVSSSAGGRKEASLSWSTGTKRSCSRRRWPQTRWVPRTTSTGLRPGR